LSCSDDGTIGSLAALSATRTRRSAFAELTEAMPSFPALLVSPAVTDALRFQLQPVITAGAHK
jgi:hypothetical protein